MSLVLIFAGKSVIKVIAFLVVGLVGASIGGTLGAEYLGGLDGLGAILGLLLGFFLGGILGVALVAVGIGLVVGYAAYLFALDLFASHFVALVVGFVFLVVGLALYTRILSLVTALAGGLLLYDVLRMYDLGPTVSFALAAIVTVVGIWVQMGPGRRRSPAG